MPKGGHARSGPASDPKSARSEQRGISFTALPAEGYDGEAPAFPLPKRHLWNEWVEGSGRDREKHRELDESATEATWERELELWAWVWTTPQACAWAQPSERWRLHTIAMYVRTFVICEGADATAADKGSLHRFADDIGMTPAGLRFNGWSVAKDELGAKRATQATEQYDAEGDDDSPRLRDVE